MPSSFEHAKMREERIAEVEVTFRRANERLHAHYRELGVDMDPLPFICECGNERCTKTLTMTPDEYAAMRADRARFVVVPGHSIMPAEHVVEAREGYEVIEKRGRLRELLDEL